MNHESKPAFAFARPVLCLVVDRSCSTRPILDAVRAAAAGGVDWLQIRERSLEPRALLAFARDVSEAAERGAQGRNILVIVNRRVDVALSIDAAGVHLGFDAMSPGTARKLLARGSLLGSSAHTVAAVEAAATAGVDYAHLAPILAPLSKPRTRPALGFEALRASTQHGVHVLAQGGIEARHCANVLAAGASGIAVTGSILLSEDPGAAAAKLRDALDSKSYERIQDL